MPAVVIPPLEERAGSFGDRKSNSNLSYKVLKDTIINLQRDQDHKLDSGSGNSGGGGSNKCIPVLNTQFGGKGGQDQERKPRCFDCGKKGAYRGHQGCACPGSTNNFGSESTLPKKGGGKGKAKGKGRHGGRDTNASGIMGAMAKAQYQRQTSLATTTTMVESARREIFATFLTMRALQLLPSARTGSKTL